MMFSVIVPYRNEAKYIEDCIQALRDQEFPKSEYELIFIRNRSVDGSSEIVARYPEILHLEQNVAGPYAARNKGIAVATGEIIAFTDADCVVAKDWLNQIYKGLSQPGVYLVVGKNYFAPHKSGLLRYFEDYENAKSEYVFKEYDRKYFFAYARNMAVKSELFEQVGVFVPSVQRGEDTHFVQRCLAHSSELTVVYLDGMRTEHLEMSHVRNWLSRLTAYGKSNASIERLSAYRGLDSKRRFRILLCCVRKNKYSVIQTVVCLFLLCLGNLCFAVGRMQRSRLQS